MGCCQCGAVNQANVSDETCMSSCSICGCASTPSPYYNCVEAVQETHCVSRIIQQFEAAIVSSAAFIMPACNQYAVIAFAGLVRALPGSYLWNPNVGYLLITKFDAYTGQVTVKNECFIGNAAPGTVIPKCTAFTVTTPPCECVTSPLPLGDTLTSPVRLDQVQNSELVYSDTIGSGGNYIATLSVAPAAYQIGQQFLIRANHSNPGAATIDINNLGVVSILNADGSVLLANTLKAGSFYTLTFDGTSFRKTSSMASGELSWTPTFGAGGAMTYTPVQIGAKFSILQDHLISVDFYSLGTTAGVASNIITATLPFNSVNGVTVPTYVDDVTAEPGIMYLAIGSNVASFVKVGANWNIGPNKAFAANFTYRVL